MNITEIRAAHQEECPSIEAAEPLAVDLDAILANLASCANVQSAINNMRTIGNLGVGTVTENGEELPLNRLNRRITDLGTQHILAVDRARLRHDSFCENIGLFQEIEDAINGLSDAVMASAPGWPGV